MPAEASAVSLKPSVLGEFLKKEFNNTASWCKQVISLRVGGSRMQALIPRIIHVQSNDNELKHTEKKAILC